MGRSDGAVARVVRRDNTGLSVCAAAGWAGKAFDFRGDNGCIAESAAVKGHPVVSHGGTPTDLSSSQGFETSRVDTVGSIQRSRANR